MMWQIWSPADVEKLRAAMANHPCVLGTSVEPEHTGNVTDLAQWRTERGR